MGSFLRACGRLAVVVLAVGLGMLGCRKAEVISIGAVVTLTTPSGPQYDGQEVRDGMQLAIEEVNARGGVNGRKMQLYLEDGKADVDAAKAAFQRIESAHHPLVYVSTLSGVSVGLAPLAAQSQVVLVALVASAANVSQQNEWVYRYWLTADDEVSAVANLLTKLSIHRVGVVYVDDDYGRSLFGLFKTRLEKAGGQVQSVSFAMTESDYAAKMKSLVGAEALYVVGLSSQLPGLFTALRSTGFAGTVISTNGAASPAMMGLAETQGIYVTVPAIYNPGFLYARELKQKYEAKYSKQFNQYAAVGYDTVRLLAEMLVDKETSRRGLKDLLATGFIHSGAFGEVRLNAGSRDVPIALFPARIVDGQIQY